MRTGLPFPAALLAVLLTSAARAEAPKDEEAVRAAMATVHTHFKGKPGTFAHFGDSITETLAFWTPLLYDPKGMSPEMAKARELVMGYMVKDCWRDWKGPDFGNQSGRTIDWADEHVAEWLKKLDPEVVLILFGTNDMKDGNAADFGRKLRTVVRRCLDNGSIVILTTPPPRSGMEAKSVQFAEAVRQVAAESHAPLIDFQSEILKRRPDDWDGSLPRFKEATKEDGYQAPTLVAGDGIHPSNPAKFGDYSEESLKNNGYALRNYLTLMKYAEVLRTVVKPEKK
jgi:lysophospholipase L1-like esterase